MKLAGGRQHTITFLSWILVGIMVGAAIVFDILGIAPNALETVAMPMAFTLITGQAAAGIRNLAKERNGVHVPRAPSVAPGPAPGEHSPGYSRPPELETDDQPGFVDGEQ